MNDSWIGPGAVVDRAIIDKEVHISQDALIGFGDDNTPNRQSPKSLNTGLTVVGKRARLPAGVRIGHNVMINPGTCEEAFPGSLIASGESV
jgi:glucose-1-phosphate adenylyltransferase